MTPLEAPRTAVPRRGVAGPSWEQSRWVFQRVSGVLLVGLVLAHLTVNLVVGEGIDGIRFALVAERWANPFWQLWAVVMLWLAMLHGANGVWTVVDDYATRARTRWLLRTVLVVATSLLVALGTLVVLTFDPCPPGAPSSALPSSCG